MNELIGSIFPGAEAGLLIAMDLLLKATIVLLLGYVVHALLGRRRALARSALWNATLAALLFLPVASLSLPRVSVAVLPARIPVQSATIDRREALPLPDRSVPADTQVQVGQEVTFDVEPIASASAPVLPRAEPEQGRAIRIAALGATIYLAVAALLAIRLAASVVAVRRVKHRCEIVHDRAWTGSRARTHAMLEISRSVGIVKSPSISIPMVIGWLSPVIVIPGRLATSANAKLIDMVLRHELAHVRRADFAWNLVHKLVRIVYWPHPLFWPVGRVIGAVREQACDDVCVQAIGSGAAYRDSLLEVASSLVRRPELSLGLALARETNLSRRLAWIEMSNGRSRCLLSAPLRFGAGLVVLALTGILGAIVIERSSLSAEQDQGTALKAARSPAPPPVIQIVVRAKDTGKPLPGASVRFSIDFESVNRKADGAGVVRFDVSKRLFKDSLSFDVWADGYVQQRYFFSQIDARHPKIPPRFVVELLPGEETLGGKVIDERGRPIAGADVQIWGYLGEKKEPHELAYHVDARTDDKGQWRCRCFRGLTFAYLYLSHPDYLSDGRSHPREHGSPRPGTPTTGDNQPLAGLLDFSDVQVMTTGVSLAGKVTDQYDKPVANAEVGWIETNQQQTAFHDDLQVNRTDISGHFRFPHVRAGKLVVQVKAKGFAPELKPVDAVDGASQLIVKLGPSRSLAGRVVDTNGEPIPDVFVNVDMWRGFRSLGVFLNTDMEGRFLWLDAPPETILINASRTGFAPITRRSVAAQEHAITLILNRSLAISGRITDAATGKPIDRSNVEIGVTDPRTGGIGWVQGQNVFSFQGRLQGDIDVENRPELRLRVRAPGYEPAVSRVFRREENQVEYDVKLTNSDMPQGVVVNGQVRRPDGKPLEGAVVTVTYPMQSTLPRLHLQNGLFDPIQPGMATTKTDATGRFSLGREPDPAGRYFAIVVIHPDFYAEVDRSAIEKNSTIAAEPWGRIEGVALDRGKPAAGATVKYFSDRLHNLDVPSVFDRGEVKADEKGRFVLDRVVPGDVRVTRVLADGANGQQWFSGELLALRSGETARIEVGGRGRGRSIVAKIITPVGFDSKTDYVQYSEFEIQTVQPRIPFPRDVIKKHDGSMTQWAKAWWVSVEGRAYRRNWFGYSRAKLQPDGTIHASDLPAGEYRLKLTYRIDPRGPGVSPERIAYATKQFVIPEIQGGRDDEPVDLGVLRPQRKQTLEIGDGAPAFEAETLDGGRVKLEDFRGKYVLLDFWATWCGPCVAEIPSLKAVHDRFGNDERFAILSLSLDAAKEAPRKLVAERAIAWKQGFLGEWSDGGVPGLYHVEAIPAIFLIGPDGKLLAKDIQGEAIEAAVANALRKP